MEELERQIREFTMPNGSGGVETPESKTVEEKNNVERISFAEKN